MSDFNIFTRALCLVGRIDTRSFLAIYFFRAAHSIPLAESTPKTETHDKYNPLLETVQYSDASLNNQKPLTKLDQSILLALCLDVKNDNPADGLTAEQMAPFLERVLCSHDNWMIYSTALLERAWLESESNHRRER